jgi:AcrR family transcriptional regulator
MPKIVDPATQRRVIRDAARRVFAQRGVEATGLVQVAAAAGMGRSSLYHYYPNKVTLVRDLVKDLLDAEETFFARAAGGKGSPRQRLESLAEMLPWAFREWTAVGRLLSELRASDARRFRGFFRRIRASLASLISEGQERGEFARGIDPQLTAATMIGAIDGILLQLLVEPACFPESDELFRGLSSTLMRLVAP